MEASSPTTERAGRQLGLLWGGVAAAIVAAAPLLVRVAPHLPPCLFRSVTGIPCPSCGTTRAALALAAGHPLAALRWNPLGTAAMIALVLGGLVAGARALGGAGIREPERYPRWVRVAALAAIAANWIWLLFDGR